MTERKPRKRRQGIEIVDHCCRNCFGRIRRRGEGEGVTFFCPNCGLEGADTVRSICACGVTRKRGQHHPKMKCVKNPDVSPVTPLLIVPVEVD